MAVYSSPQVLNNEPTPSPGLAAQVKCSRATVSCTASPATTDTLNFFDVPAGARLLFAVAEATDMDTNGTPTLTLNIGDTDDPDRIFSAITIGQTGAVSSAVAVAGFDHQYTAKTRITGTAGANAATGAAGSVTLALFYVVEGLPS